MPAGFLLRTSRRKSLTPDGMCVCFTASLSATSFTARGLTASSAPTISIPAVIDGPATSGETGRQWVIDAEYSMASQTYMTALTGVSVGFETNDATGIVPASAPAADPPEKNAPTGGSLNRSSVVLGVGVVGLLGAGVSVHALARRMPHLS